VWTADKPFDHQGAHYRFEQAYSEVKPLQQPQLDLLRWASEAAIPVAGRHADVYALWGESLEQVRELTGRVRAEAARHGREISFSVSFRPILAATEEQAWGACRTHPR
jgi:alkanesulfonate monooxygenase